MTFIHHRAHRVHREIQKVKTIRRLRRFTQIKKKYKLKCNPQIT
jgi:hypothetical protein